MWDASFGSIFLTMPVETTNQMFFLPVIIASALSLRDRGISLVNFLSSGSGVVALVCFERQVSRKLNVS